MKEPLHHNNHILVIALFVAFATFLAYLPALSNGFVNWDDHVYVYENPNIRSIDPAFLFSFYFSNWHPLTMLSYALDYAVWELNPCGYHLTNILFHTSNTFLVFILVVRLIRTNGEGQGEGNFQSPKALIAASVTALLFGIHPLRVETVVWVSERKDVLYAFFYLLSILVYLKYAGGKRQKAIYYGLCLFLFSLSLMSKPMAVTLPMVLLLIDYFPFKRLTVEKGYRNAKLVIYEKLPFFMLSVLIALVTIWLHWTIGDLISVEKLPFITRIISSMRAYIFYLIKMLAPLDLAPLYPSSHTIDLFTLKYFGSLTLLLIITFITLRHAKKNNLLAAIWLYYLITLLPVIGILEAGNQAVADRYTYLPSLGPFLLVGICAGYLFGRYPKKGVIPVISILLILTVLLSSKTIKQIGLWRDSLTLWSHEIRLYPDVPLAYYSRGLAFNKISNFQLAIEDLNKAIELDPQYIDAYCERGLIYQNLGNYQEAMKDYSKAIELNPQFAKAYNNRGNAYLRLEDYPHAIDDFNQAIKLNANIQDYYYNRGVALHNLGNYEQALKDYNRAIELDPQHAKAYSNRGNVFKRLGNHRQAIIDYNTAIELDSQSGVIYYNRGITYHESGYYQQAVNDYSKAIELNSQYTDAYLNRGVAYKDIKDYDQAIKDFNKAIELTPQDAMAYYNLGFIYLELKNIEQALLYYKKAANLGSKDAQAYLKKYGN